MDAGPSHCQRVDLVDVQDMNGQKSDPHERQPAGWAAALTSLDAGDQMLALPC